MKTINGHDFIVGNVPFGLKVDGDKRRSEIVFLERCLNLADFRVAIIVPDSLLNTTRDKPIRQWILANFGYRATISISSGKHKIFYNSTAKTSICVIDKYKPPGNYKILMAHAEKTEDFQSPKFLQDVQLFFSRGVECSKSIITAAEKTLKQPRNTSRKY